MLGCLCEEVAVRANSVLVDCTTSISWHQGLRE
jgi:hypothetical protein